MTKKQISPNDLIQNILNIMDKQISKLSKEPELSESQVKILTDMLRVLISSSKLDKDNEDEVKANLTGLSTQQLKDKLKEFNDKV